MARNKFPIVLYIVVALAGFGFVISLMRNPGGFMVSILISIAIAFLIFKVLSAVLRRRQGETSDEMKKYREAVKQSNKRFEKQDIKPSTKRQPIKKKRRRRKRAPHLRVIEGKKSEKNKNDQASN
ncbi:MAG TPA: SA1362 family protein [Pseudogracilibacillus sp.]|nr:SA1362 family protein [Pseudogracilibacillus sp.]